MWEAIIDGKLKNIDPRNYAWLQKMIEDGSFTETIKQNRRFLVNEAAHLVYEKDLKMPLKSNKKDSVEKEMVNGMFKGHMLYSKGLPLSLKFWIFHRDLYNKKKTQERIMAKDTGENAKTQKTLQRLSEEIQKLDSLILRITQRLVEKQERMTTVQFDGSEMQIPDRDNIKLLFETGDQEYTREGKYIPKSMIYKKDTGIVYRFRENGRFVYKNSTEVDAYLKQRKAAYGPGRRMGNTRRQTRMPNIEPLPRRERATARGRSAGRGGRLPVPMGMTQGMMPQMPQMMPRMAAPMMQANPYMQQQQQQYYPYGY